MVPRSESTLRPTVVPSAVITEKGETFASWLATARYSPPPRRAPERPPRFKNRTRAVVGDIVPAANATARQFAFNSTRNSLRPMNR